ncbi:TadE/TadG family type IV pilus assembly protein [Methylobacterium marchantiae]|uniref:TadE/TadG family type IV pilus assembly protein n=1 Tax=Methylobacterium marchantiae TaxID=600331 RepID=A0ABW3WYA5_9HYPH|nr:hypothetical protein AIGOOFII_0191 [Methylobacterium marchantiae]
MRRHDRVRRFVGDGSGVSGVEFALLAPVLIAVFVGMVELTRAYGTSQRASRATRAMADLISRNSPSSDTVSIIYQGGRSMLAPFDASKAEIVLTAVGVYLQKDGSFKAKVCSSVTSLGTQYPAGTDLGAPPPSETRDKGRYVMAEMKLKYAPIIDVFPVLKNFSFEKKVTWPVRSATAKEIVLPNGAACPSS